MNFRAKVHNKQNRNSGGTVPQPTRIIINLAPADLRKEGPAYDLPIALGIMAATDQINADLNHTVFLGELSLDGGLRHTTGVLSMVALARELYNTTRTPAGRWHLLGGVRVVIYRLLA